MIISFNWRALFSLQSTTNYYSQINIIRYTFLILWQTKPISNIYLFVTIEEKSEELKKNKNEFECC
jgi:hypothetical protein